jgi:poly(3-hydroxybutyrate) depolymerase
MKLFSPSSLLRAALACAAIWSGGNLHAAPIPFGSSQIEVGTGTNAITVYTYKPGNYHDGAVLFVFHGVLRNARDYRDDCLAIAERFNLILAAPLFDTNRFPGSAYQRGGLFKHGVLQAQTNWTYSLLPGIINDVRQRENNPKLPYYFIGHSAGAQFLMRLAAFSPLEARRIVVANPGSDLFPRRDWKYGYGFGGLPQELSDDDELQRYLSAPLTLYLGTADTDPQDPELDRSPAAELEGRFRLERGRSCFEYAQRLAQEHGWKFNWRKVETFGVAHDAKTMFAVEEIGDALFGAEKSAVSGGL